MLLSFRKKRIRNTLKENAAQNKIANRIVFTCIRFQEKWADLMNHYTERLPRKGKLIMFFLFCILGGCLSLYLIADSMMRRPGFSFTISHFKATPFAGKSGDENIRADIIVTKIEYQRIQHFKLYMDSLDLSPSGKKIYDSILTNRTGLMDSVLFIEKIFQSQNKK